MSKQDEGIDQEEAKFYHDERRTRLAQKSTIEPTEEQKQAAQEFVARHGEQNGVIDSGGQARLEWSPTHTVTDIARLLAEREAKLLVQRRMLQDEVSHVRSVVDAERSTNDTLRARVAELEVDATDRLRATKADLQRESAANEKVGVLMKRVSELEAERGAHWQRVDDGEHPDGCPDATCGECHECVRVRDLQIDVMRDERNALADREAQHLDDIKALMGFLNLACWSTFSEWQLFRDEARALIKRLARYDDAKAGVVTLEVKQATPDMIRAAAATPYLGHDDARADAPAFPTDMQHCFTVEKADAPVSTEGGEG